MKNATGKPPYLRKLIDIPKSIVGDLKKMAINSDKSLKVFIQDILINVVERHRNKQ